MGERVGGVNALSDPMAIPPRPWVVMFLTVMFDEGIPILIPASFKPLLIATPSSPLEMKQFSITTSVVESGLT